MVRCQLSARDLARHQLGMKLLGAVHSATLAITEMLRFCREGPHSRRPPFGDVEVVELLALALRGALEVETAEQDRDGHPDDAEARNRLLVAVSDFLDGWVP